MSLSQIFVFVFLLKWPQSYGTWPISLECWDNGRGLVFKKNEVKFCTADKPLPSWRVKNISSVVWVIVRRNLWPRFSRIPGLEGKNWIYIWNQCFLSFPMIYATFYNSAVSLVPSLVSWSSQPNPYQPWFKFYFLFYLSSSSLFNVFILVAPLSLSLFI